MVRFYSLCCVIRGVYCVKCEVLGVVIGVFNGFSVRVLWYVCGLLREELSVWLNC